MFRYGLLVLDALDIDILPFERFDELLLFDILPFIEFIEPLFDILPFIEFEPIEFEFIEFEVIEPLFEVLEFVVPLFAVFEFVTIAVFEFIAFVLVLLAFEVFAASPPQAAPNDATAKTADNINFDFI